MVFRDRQGTFFRCSEYSKEYIQWGEYTRRGAAAQRKEKKLSVFRASLTSKMSYSSTTDLQNIGEKSNNADFAIRRAIEQMNFFRTCIGVVLLHFGAEGII